MHMQTPVNFSEFSQQKLTHGLDCVYLKAFVKEDKYSTKDRQLNLFQRLVYSGDYDVVCVSKIWLNELCA